MAPRIDRLVPGSVVTLHFSGSGAEYDEPAIFLGIKGEGHDRKARFLSSYFQPASGRKTTDTYEWDAFRDKGRWVYGSGSDKLTLVSVDYDPFDFSK